ncbi:CLUMA_CG010389, isoform A [Clunio marinus]|uniref:CLUMA_CG010389, isoform A n=1 Tax=Clunio marinus TaxID=568069 RepID=A0A1J1I9P9_9DIPT|nr:CLUMA_CG010389, isoform A [Clunio marinus]
MKSDVHVNQRLFGRHVFVKTDHIKHKFQGLINQIISGCKCTPNIINFQMLSFIVLSASSLIKGIHESRWKKNLTISTMKEKKNMKRINGKHFSFFLFCRCIMLPYVYLLMITSQNFTQQPEHERLKASDHCIMEQFSLLTCLIKYLQDNCLCFVFQKTTKKYINNDIVGLTSTFGVQFHFWAKVEDWEDGRWKKSIEHNS